MKNLVLRIMTSFALGSIFWVSFVYLPPRVFSIILAFVLMHIIMVEWKTVFPIRSYKSWLLVPLYPTLSFMLMIYMNENVLYHHLLLYLFVILAGFDSGSYIVGSLTGQHIIMPYCMGAWFASFAVIRVYFYCCCRSLCASGRSF